eukprot:7384023-Prymnesium_polylepis.1
MAAVVMPSILHRVFVFPMAAGNVSAAALLSETPGNAGGAHIGTFSERRRRAGNRTHQILQQPIDKVIQLTSQSETSSLRRMTPIRLMKVDVEGFECNVLDGMRQLLHQRAVAAIKSEVSRDVLLRQGCSEEGLLLRLASRSFSIKLDLGCVDCMGRPQARCSKAKSMSRNKQRMYHRKGQYDVQALLTESGERQWRNPASLVKAILRRAVNKTAHLEDVRSQGMGENADK